MVDDVHAAVRAGTGGPVERAGGEGRVQGVVGGFEEVGEFVEDVGVGGGGGAVVWKGGWGVRMGVGEGGWGERGTVGWGVGGGGT